DSLAAEATWRRGDAGLEVQVARAKFANADLAGEVAGTWRALPASERASPGFVDLKGTFSRGLPGRAASYLPNGIAITRARAPRGAGGATSSWPHSTASTRGWVERAVEAAGVTGAPFEVGGPLWEWPFGAGSSGNLLFEAEVRDTRLQYDPAWPAVGAIGAWV